MTLFPERERAFESKFAHDEETRFRALARRNRLIGQWAAEKLGFSGKIADDYIKGMSEAIATAGADDMIVARLSGDFERAGVIVPEAEIRDKMAELLAQALIQVGGTAT